MGHNKLKLQAAEGARSFLFFWPTSAVVDASWEKYQRLLVLTTGKH